MQAMATGPAEDLALELELCEGQGRVIGRGRYELSGLLAERSERCAAMEVVLRAVAGVGVHTGAELGRLSVSVTPDWNVTNSKTDFLQHRRQERHRPALAPSEGKLDTDSLLQHARSFGMRVTESDIRGVQRFALGVSAQPALAEEGTDPAETELGAGSIRQLQTALPTLEQRHYAAAQEAMQRGQASEAVRGNRSQ